MADIAKTKQRQQKSKAVYYKVQFGITEVNKKRKRGNHLRNHPSDAEARENYVASYGQPALAKLKPLTSKGRRREWIAEIKAAAREAKAAARAALRFAAHKEQVS